MQVVTVAPWKHPNGSNLLASNHANISVDLATELTIRCFGNLYTRGSAATYSEAGRDRARRIGLKRKPGESFKAKLPTPPLRMLRRLVPAPEP